MKFSFLCPIRAYLRELPRATGCATSSTTYPTTATTTSSTTATSTYPTTTRSMSILPSYVAALNVES